jgi:hypothetical protein
MGKMITTVMPLENLTLSQTPLPHGLRWLEGVEMGVDLKKMV